MSECEGCKGLAQAIIIFFDAWRDETKWTKEKLGQLVERIKKLEEK